MEKMFRENPDQGKNPFEKNLVWHVSNSFSHAHFYHSSHYISQHSFHTLKYCIYNSERITTTKIFCFWGRGFFLDSPPRKGIYSPPRAGVTLDNPLVLLRFISSTSLLPLFFFFTSPAVLYPPYPGMESQLISCFSTSHVSTTVHIHKDIRQLQAPLCCGQ